MTSHDVTAVVSRWHEGAASDLRSVQWLMKGRQWLQALFFCHLAIEKTLKALIVQTSKTHASFHHNLMYLVGKTALQVDKAQLAFLEEINRFHIEGRYPSDQAKLRKELEKIVAQQHVRNTERFIAWCKKRS